MSLVRAATLFCLLFVAATPLFASEPVPLAWYGVASSHYEPGPSRGAWILADEGDLPLVPPTLRLKAQEALRSLEPRETLLFLSAGLRPTGGYRVAVTDVRCDGAKVLVLWTVQGPPPGAMVSQALTHPMALVRIPAPLSAIELREAARRPD